MAIKDTAAKAYETGMREYGNALAVGRGVYDASAPYRAHSKSIIAAAKGNLFEFPVFISSSVQLDYATATSSLLEQVYASYLQSALSLNPIVDESLVKNKTPFAAYQSDTNRYVEYTDMDYAHDAVHNEIVMENGDSMEFSIMSIEDADGRVIIEQYNKQPLSEFDHYFQEDAQDAKDYEIERLTEKLKKAGEHIKDLNDELKDANDTTAYFKKESTRQYKRAEGAMKHAVAADKRAKAAEKRSVEKKALDEYKATIKEAEKELNDAKKRGDEIEKLRKLQKQIDDSNREYNLALAKFGYQQEKDERDEKAQAKRDELERKKFKHTQVRERHLDKQREKERAEDKAEAQKERLWKYAPKAPEVLDESKLKKLNTMKPLMMNVSYYVKAQDGTLSHPVNYVIGVKTFNRVIDADILPDVAEYPLKEMNKIARKAKWRAGELKFFRDIVFKVKQKKQTAVDSRDPKRKWYRRLYELAHMTGDAPTKAAIKGKNITWSVVKSQIEDDFDFGVIPNASLIISSGDVINVKAKTGIDLLNGRTAAKLCKELFLISMVVIDTDAESIKILLPDNHDDYEVHSLASVNKQLAELSTAGSKTRDIFKLLG